VAAQLHLAVDALALQLLLERAQRLLDVIVANDDLHKSPSHSLVGQPAGPSGNSYRPPEEFLGGATPLAAPSEPFNPLQGRGLCGESLVSHGGTGNLNNWVIGG